MASPTAGWVLQTPIRHHHRARRVRNPCGRGPSTLPRRPQAATTMTRKADGEAVTVSQTFEHPTRPDEARPGARLDLVLARVEGEAPAARLRPPPRCGCLNGRRGRSARRPPGAWCRRLTEGDELDPIETSAVARRARWGQCVARYLPVDPSRSSRRMSACPAWRAVSSRRCVRTQRRSTIVSAPVSWQY